MKVFTTILTFLAAAQAYAPPSYSGYKLVWASTFEGKKDALPPTSEWNIITGNNNFNNELQTYTKSVNNLRQTGGGTVEIIPHGDKTALHGWTSARLESNYKFTPAAGKITIAQSRLRLAGNPASQKKGLWPAFWILGNSQRHGTKWPASGEIDVFENINGQSTVYGGLHCDVAPGGVCNEPYGLVGQTSLPDNHFHSWRVEFNRKSSDFKSQSITWFKDGVQFHKVTGAQIGNSNVWKTVCGSDLFFILNIAVGGDFPGAPNSKTVGGSGSMMEIAYVAHYVSN
ncbi:putative endo-1,3(4)-beta-glucanase [Mariannaea sp. PMI_226]|nr:putative endo-1,3(4)-beta-glucanase [Mariannaea sp. PMI_226]